MATINNKNNDLKTQAKYINKLALEVGSDIVKLAVKNGQTSQDILTKVMKGGVTIFGMQQDFALTVLEKVAGNVKSSKYFKESLVKYAETKETVAEKVDLVKENKYVKDSLKKYAATKETVAEKIELVKEKATETLNVVKSNLNIVAEIPANIEEVTEVAEEMVTETVETVETVAEVVEETVVETVTEVVADNITTIKGLGAKSAAVLVAGGYDTFEKLANATEEELRAALAAAGTTFKKFNPAPWIEAAKNLIK